MMKRINAARKLLLDERVVVTGKTKKAWYLQVDDYDIIINDRGCTCTCPFGSLWGLKENHLPCRHIIAAMAAMILRVKRKGD